MLLDLGAGTTDFAVFEEGRVIDVGSFPIGGGHITSDIAIGFRAPVAIAEEIKVRYATAFLGDRSGRRETIALADFLPGDASIYTVRDLVDIIAARLTDIFELATKALRKSGRAGLLPGGVVLTGGVAEISGIQDLGRRELKLPIELTKAVSIDALEDIVPPRLAIPIGLVLLAESNFGNLAMRGRPWDRMVRRLLRLFESIVP